MQENDIRDALRDIGEHIRAAYSRFEMLSDPDLIEAEIYLIKCLEAKRSHLLRQARLAPQSVACEQGESVAEPDRNTAPLTAAQTISEVLNG